MLTCCLCCKHLETLASTLRIGRKLLRTQATRTVRMLATIGHREWRWLAGLDLRPSTPPPGWTGPTQPKGAPPDHQGSRATGSNAASSTAAGDFQQWVCAKTVERRIVVLRHGSAHDATPSPLHPYSRFHRRPQTCPRPHRRHQQQLLDLSLGWPPGTGSFSGFI